jgi:hypothetical protein
LIERDIAGQLVVTASNVLHERVRDDEYPQ